MIQNTETINIEAADLTDEILSAVNSLPHVYKSEYKEGLLTVYCSGGKHNLVRVLGLLQEASVSVGRVYSELPTLNDVFLEITGTDLRDKE